MKALMIIILIISTPRIGDKMTENTDILPGQTWELILNADNPFETPDTIRVSVREVKNGYVLYSHEYVGHHSNLRESDSMLYFRLAYKNSTLIRNER